MTKILATLKQSFGILLLLLTAVYSCTTDFEVNDEWKEIGVVYCLLDQKDSFQYVRLQRAYLNENTDAYQIAQVSDSIYYTQEVKVELIDIRGNTTSLEPFLVENKTGGDFSSEPYFAYRTPEGFKLTARQEYKLRVFNTQTGYEMRSTTRVVPPGEIQDPTSSITSLAFCNSNREFQNYVTRQMSILSGKWVKFYDMSVELHYGEFDSLKIEDTTWHVLNWPLGGLVGVSNTKGNLPSEVRYKGDEFYNYLGNNMEPKPGFGRVVKHLEFVFQGGGQDIYDYINVNRPSVGIVQKKPEYTNIENGLGIFSSRITQRAIVKLDDCSIDRILARPDTKVLGFVR